MNFSRALREQFTKLLLAVLLLTSVILIQISDPAPLTNLRDLYFDQLQQAQPREDDGQPVLIVDISDEALESLGQWPWPRSLIADMVDRLAEAGAVVIAFDVLFSEPDRFSPNALADDPYLSQFFRQEGVGTLPDTDDILAQSFRTIPVILGVAAQLGGTQSELPSRFGIVEIGDHPLAAIPRFTQRTHLVPTLYDSATGVGNINVSPFDNMDVIRRVPLLWQHGAEIMPTLALETLRVALSEQTLLAFSAPENPTRLEQIRLGGASIPVDSRGQFQVYYRSLSNDMFLSAHQIFRLSQDELRARVEGKVLFVGTSAAGLLDIRQTALRENIPGVAVHAQILEQILQGSYLVRDFRVEMLESALFAGLSLIIVVMVRFVAFKYVAAFVTVSLAALHLAAFISFTRTGILFDAASISVLLGFMFLAVFSFSYFQSAQEKRVIRESFARYVAPSILKKIEQNRNEIQLGGEIKDICIMFCDLRNFTSLGEDTNPLDLMGFVNEVFTEVTQKVTSNAGFVDKFIGDAVMALWNAPLDVTHDTDKACKAALEIRKSLSEYRSKLHNSQGVPVAIGIAKGPACIGNIGSLTRMNYSAIGQAVNLAARLEQGCRYVGYDILVSKSVADQSPEFATLPAGALALKGLRDKPEAYILVGDQTVQNSKAFVTLQSRHLDLVKAIRADAFDISDKLELCLACAPDINRDLVVFYKTLADRFEDFQTSN